MSVETFGALADGRPVERVTLAAGELTVRLLTLGAILQDVRLAGVPDSLTLGSEALADYEMGMAYYGAIVGPVANRIAGATMPVGGETLHLIANENGRTTLHGGRLGTHARLWTLAAHDAVSATFTLNLADGEEGYPGNRHLTARFALAAPATLTMTLQATTDAPTPINLANHSYWRLGGSDLAGHRLEIAAERYTPVDADLIPTGEAARVDGSQFDFRQPRPIGPEAGATYDHNFCLAAERRPAAFAARLTGPTSLSVTLETTEPGLQIYDASRNPDPFHGLAIEAQCWPDAPHHKGFPSILLEPGHTYRQETRWVFSR